MSNYAFIDSKRKNKIYASKCSAEDLSNNYFCPTKDCEAILKLRSLTGEKIPHFYAFKSHSPHCSISKVKTNHSQLDSSDFSMKNLLDSMSKQKISSNSSTGKKVNEKNKDTENNKITTTRTLYYYCKSFDIDHIINGTTKIKDIIADDRTNYIFTKGIFGLRLVECLYSNYNSEKKCLYFKYPVNPSSKNLLTLCVNFENEDTFIKLRNKLHTLKSEDPNVYICILANWLKTKCTLTSTRQMGILRE